MTKICDQCGYPVMDVMANCPNCGAQTGVQLQVACQTVRCPYCGEDVDASLRFCPMCGEPLVDDGYQEPAEAQSVPEGEVVPVCTLRPLARPGERSSAVRTFEDMGDGVDLNRDNTLPGEDTIDAELQASLHFVDGNWFIQEECDGRLSTFVHAGVGIKLSPGDIIRMGDREFEFNITTR